jgi:hypothetical protein
VPRSCDEVEDAEARRLFKNPETILGRAVVGLRGLVVVLNCGPGAEETRTWACALQEV